MSTLELETTIRARNQVTIPKTVADTHGFREGQRVVIVVDDDHPDEFIVRRLRDTYAGILSGVYGRNTAEREAYARGESEAWS
jgi:AbrB family looped-hinge helix DNA binding protein